GRQDASDQPALRRGSRAREYRIGRDASAGLRAISQPLPSNGRDDLMRHKYRQCRIAQDVAGGTAKDELPQSALRKGPLDQEVATQCIGVLQNGFTGEAAVEADG